MRQSMEWGYARHLYKRKWNRAYNHTIASTHIPLGIDEEILNRFNLRVINISPGDQLILYSDGLTDAMDAENDMFGHR